MMSNTNRKVVDEINYWLKYIDCALAHPHPLPKGKHVYRSDLNTIPEVRDIYDCLYKLYSEEAASMHFREPVNALELGIFNYYEIVKEPMCIRTILDRIADDHYYSQAAQVMEDVEKIWENCENYNGVNSDITKDSKKCKDILHNLREKVAEEKPAPIEEVDKLIDLVEDMGEEVTVLIESFFRKEEPSLILPSGDLDLDALKVKHFKAIKRIMEDFSRRGRR